MNPVCEFWREFPKSILSVRFGDQGFLWQFPRVRLWHHFPVCHDGVSQPSKGDDTTHILMAKGFVCWVWDFLGSHVRGRVCFWCQMIRCFWVADIGALLTLGWVICHRCQQYDVL